MARGIEVLQAALAGKNLRYRDNFGTWRGWFHLDPQIGILRSPDHLWWNEGMNSFWEFEWEVEEPSMTFLEAVAAMDAGQIVERDGRQYRLNPDTEYYEARSVVLKDSWRPDLVWTQEDVHAADWHVVSPLSEKESAQVMYPTVQEAVEFVLHTASYDGPPFLWHCSACQMSMTGNRQGWQRVMQWLQGEWPAMFRKE